MREKQEYKIELFYDGACPLCSREVTAIRRLDRKGRIQFTNIADPGFSAPDYGHDLAFFIDQIQARMPNGDWVQGVEAFRRVYTLVGFGMLVAPTRLPGLSQLLDWGYKKFAANRLRLTGRCDANGCDVKGAQQA
ncbi:thiol-disulfide oxidoreductase DCC family protein [Myxococcota bacterium]